MVLCLNLMMKDDKGLIFYSYKSFIHELYGSYFRVTNNYQLSRSKFDKVENADNRIRYLDI